MRLNDDFLIKLGTIALIGFIILVVIMVVLEGNKKAKMCEQYREYRLADVPAKCVDYFSPQKSDTLIIQQGIR